MLCKPGAVAGKFAKSDKIGQFLDRGDTVLVSFGSVIKAHTLPEDRLSMLLGAFEKLKPMQVLWKWESEGTENKNLATAIVPILLAIAVDRIK